MRLAGWLFVLSVSAGVADRPTFAQSASITPAQRLTHVFSCPTGLPPRTDTVCCDFTADIDADGNVVRVKAKCSDPAYERPVEACQSARRYTPAMQAGKPVPYHLSDTQDFLPGVLDHFPTPEEMREMSRRPRACPAPDDLIGALRSVHRRG